MLTRPGVTIPQRAPDVVRAMRNGSEKGSGLRLYVPTALTQDLGLAPGQFYRLNRHADGRLTLLPTNPDLEEASPRIAGEEPTHRIRPELTYAEAMALEAYISLGDATPREQLLVIAKRIRRRMRLAGWPTPDRREDHLELVVPAPQPLAEPLASAWGVALVEEVLSGGRA